MSSTPYTYHCHLSVSGSVSQWVIVSDFGDSYWISEVCRLVFLHVGAYPRPCWVLHILGPSCCLRKCRVRDIVLVKADWPSVKWPHMCTSVSCTHTHSITWSHIAPIPPPTTAVLCIFLVWFLSRLQQCILRDWFHIGCCVVCSSCGWLYLAGPRPNPE